MGSKRETQILDKITEAAAAVREHERAIAAATKRRDEWLRKGVAAGMTSGVLSRAAGVSRQRVTQIAPVAPPTETVIHAQAEPAPVSCVSDPDTVPSLAGVAEDLSGVTTTRLRNRAGGARTMVLDTRNVATLAAILHLADTHDARRVILAGPSPVDFTTGATKGAAVRAWATAGTPEGWVAGEHYLSDPDTPTLKFARADDPARRVTIIRGAAWWGESDADADTCMAAWTGVQNALDKIAPFTGAQLHDSPAQTGRALWRRTIPEGKGYEVLSDELRELIRTTSGQGRVEVLPPAGDAPAGATIMDGRFMYAALTWGMPVGPPRRWTGAELRALADRDREAVLRGRGRWHITARVPAGWDHVGMLMAPRDGRGWCYPSTPGETFTTWADGSEVWAALARGWEVQTHEGITWKEGKPLDVWRDHLVSIWRSAQQSPAPAAQLGAKMIRSILLFTLGGFATGARTITRTVSVDEAGIIPAGAEVSRVGDDRLTYEMPGVIPAAVREALHPEWSATVWARARGRLLTGRGGVGALHLPRASVMGFATDALYLAGPAPAWADNGEPGQFRVKGTTTATVEWPATLPAMHALSDQMEH